MLVALLALGGVAVGAPQSPRQSLLWAASLPVAKRLAQKSRLPILGVVQIGRGAGWPVTGTLDDPRFVTAARDFVCLRVDHPDLLKGLTPSSSDPDHTTLIVVDALGNLVCRVGGFMWPKDALEVLALAQWSHREGESVARAAQANPRDGTRRAELSLIRAMRGELASAEALLAQASQLGGPAATRAAAYLAMGDSLRSQGEYRASFEPLRQSLALARTPRQQFTARLRYMSSLSRIGEQARAEAEARRAAQIAGIDAEDKRTAQLIVKRLEDARKRNGG